MRGCRKHPAEKLEVPKFLFQWTQKDRAFIRVPALGFAYIRTIRHDNGRLIRIRTCLHCSFCLVTIFLSHTNSPFLFTWLLQQPVYKV